GGPENWCKKCITPLSRLMTPCAAGMPRAQLTNDTGARGENLDDIPKSGKGSRTPHAVTARIPVANSMVRVLVADGHPVVRTGLRAILVRQYHIGTLGEAGTGAEVLQRVANESWDVVVLAASLPDSN